MSDSQPSPESSVTIFLDRTHQSKHTERLLRLLGVAVQVHRNNFEHDAPDHEWIPICAAKGWAIITGDKGIQNDGLNRAAVISCGAKVFIVHDHKSKGLEQTAALIAGRRKIARTAENNVGPFYCAVSMVGDAHVGLPKFYPGGYAIQVEPVTESAIAAPNNEQLLEPSKQTKAKTMKSGEVDFGD